MGWVIGSAGGGLLFLLVLVEREYGGGQGAPPTTQLSVKLGLPGSLLQAHECAFVLRLASKIGGFS